MSGQCRLLTSTVVLAAAAWSRAASAQAWVSDVHLSVASGIEGADQSIQLGWQRARGRLVLGLDLGVDERGRDAYGFRVFTELERSIAVGAEAGYLLWVLPELNVFVGASSVLAPETLFGGTVAATYVLSLGERLGLGIWTSFSALPLGSDRPEGDGIVVWGLLGVGVRARL